MLSSPYLAYGVAAEESTGSTYEDFPEEPSEGRRRAASVEDGAVAAAPVPVPRDWDAEFQAAVDLTKTEPAEAYRRLAMLGEDFADTASTYGRIIIAEAGLRPEQKTIRPAGVGGVAGGEKYIVHGVMFKFALDRAGLYGGDAGAMKAAGHELKGLLAYYHCGVRGLAFPLMCLVDYRGFRLVAMSLLPLARDSLVYGTAEAGLRRPVVHADDPALNALMRETARRLNLRGHRVGPEKTKLHAALDLEGHRAAGRFYLLDFARAFPPARPPGRASPPRLLSELLRPELVASYSRALSPDAAFIHATVDRRYPEMSADLAAATRHLLERLVPECAAWLQSAELRPAQLKPALHRRGINLRYLGRVALAVAAAPAEEPDAWAHPRHRHPLQAGPGACALCAATAAYACACGWAICTACFAEGGCATTRPERALALLRTEMVARTLRALIWEELRALAGTAAPAAERQVLVRALNMFLAGYQSAPAPHLAAAFLAKYGLPLLLPPPVPVLERLAELTGMVLEPEALAEVEAGTRTVALQDVGYSGASVLVKTMNIVEHAVAESMALEVAGTTNARLVGRVSERFERALAQVPTALQVLLSWARFLAHHARVQAGLAPPGPAAAGFFQQAEAAYLLAVDLDPALRSEAAACLAGRARHLTALAFAGGDERQPEEYLLGSRRQAGAKQVLARARLLDEAGLAPLVEAELARLRERAEPHAATAIAAWADGEASLPAQHQFEAVRFSRPTWCEHCDRFIRTPVGKQGHQCTHCAMKVHRKCLPPALATFCLGRHHRLARGSSGLRSVVDNARDLVDSARERARRRHKESP